MLLVFWEGGYRNAADARTIVPVKPLPKIHATQLSFDDGRHNLVACRTGGAYWLVLENVHFTGILMFNIDGLSENFEEMLFKISTVANDLNFSF